MSKIKGISFSLAIMLVLLGAGTVLAGSSAHYAINWQVFDGGGRRVSSADQNIIMASSLGQSIIGFSTSPHYNVSSGYEYGLEPVIGNEPPAMNAHTYLPLIFKQGSVTD